MNERSARGKKREARVDKKGTFPRDSVIGQQPGLLKISSALSSLPSSMMNYGTPLTTRYRNTTTTTTHARKYLLTPPHVYYARGEANFLLASPIIRHHTCANQRLKEARAPASLARCVCIYTHTKL